MYVPQRGDNYFLHGKMVTIMGNFGVIGCCFLDSFDSVWEDDFHLKFLKNLLNYDLISLLNYTDFAHATSPLCDMIKQNNSNFGAINFLEKQ